MDVSASTSFESNNGTPDKKGHSFIGDSTLYDSALDHQLSTTVYKSCNDSKRSSDLSEQQLDNMFHKQRQLIRTLSQVLPTTDDYNLCMRWMDTLRHCTPSEKYARYRLVQEMEHQLSRHGHLGEPFTNPDNLDCELEDLLDACSEGTCEISEADSRTLNVNRDLKVEHTYLRREVNIYRLKVAALQIETNHQENQITELIDEVCQKTNGFNSIRGNIMASAHKSLKSQTAETFPHRLLSQIFESFTGDDHFTGHFAGLDYQLKCIVEKICADNYESQRKSTEESVKEKVKALKQKLIQKYDKQLEKQAQNQQADALAMKKRCFEMLKKYLLENFQDADCKPEFIKQLKTLYEKEILKL
ncbi:uncharacterized protein LOC6500866 isoform X3 [Drosophila ananassae]|uniref:uncharacterized protein LOC6500866 isoform X3 n=1 Tax=Drosophila ananassae TaxID=7217 RepID=UPI0013A5DDE9|nr:uncharacterized protein LOC6500866 isoform X3 [Drosophila ananassae]